MKIRNILLGLLAVTAFFACTPDTPVVEPELEVSTSKMVFNSSVGERPITLTTNNPWTIETDVDWISFGEESGEASAEEQQVMVYVDEYAVVGADPRTGKITVTSGELTHEIAVSQSAPEFVEDDPQEEIEQGSGTESDPYLIKTTQDMVDMRNLAKVGAETWFKMANDINLAGISWVPVNADQDFDRKIHFDGAGYTISNLSCKGENYRAYPSFFGVLYGSCRNLKFDRATIVGTGTSGVIGGYVGTSGKTAVVENVTIINSTVTSSSDRAGGVAGDAKEATFKNVSFQGTVESKKTDDEDGAHSGGFVGKTETTAVFENCSVDATVKGQARKLGGFVGTITGEVTCKGCSVKASVNSSQHYASGFVGYMGDATDVTITGCHFSGTVTGNSSVAGLVSAVETGGKLTLKESYVRGTVSPKGHNGGGLIGGMSGTADIENCWADVTLNMTGQYGGGVVGGAPGKITIKNCFMAGLINVSRGCGCIAGRLEGTAPTVEGCIAWGDITTNRSATQYSPGAIVGSIKSKGTFKDCWRKADMSFTDVIMKLVDHENVENGFPAFPDYNTTDQNQCAYHGRAAAADATISSVAKTIGWDENIWDLSGDVPALK